MKQGLELAAVILAVIAALAYLGRLLLKKFRSPFCGSGCGCSSKLRNTR